MNIALFDTRPEADAFRKLLADVAAIDSVVAPARDAFAVDVLRPTDFRAGIVYVLYYVKGMAIDDLPVQPHEVRVEILRQHLLHYAVGERKWDPPQRGLRWYAERAGLDDDAIRVALLDAEQAFRDERRRKGLLGRLFGSKGDQNE